jgi:hypothetical protein
MSLTLEWYVGDFTGLTLEPLRKLGLSSRLSV